MTATWREVAKSRRRPFRRNQPHGQRLRARRAQGRSRSDKDLPCTVSIRQDPPCHERLSPTSTSRRSRTPEFAKCFIRRGCVWRVVHPGCVSTPTRGGHGQVYSPASGAAGPRRRIRARHFKWRDLFYLYAVRALRDELTPKARTECYEALQRRAPMEHRDEVRFDDFGSRRRSGQGGRAARDRSGCACQQSRVSDRRRAVARRARPSRPSGLPRCLRVGRRSSRSWRKSLLSRNQAETARSQKEFLSQGRPARSAPPPVGVNTY